MKIIASVLLSAALAGVAGAQSNSVPRLPEVTVTERLLKEESAVGSYGRPEWTTQRRFAATRVYVQQEPWTVGAEQWVKAQWPKGESANYLLQEEISVGFPHRLQADVYENWTINRDGRVRHDSIALEGRWALADWGKIPLNPTLYAEWKFRDATQGPDAYELKLLLGEQIAPRWHWGFNAIYEQEVGGARVTEWAASTGISYTLIDEKLSLGVEMKVETVGEEGDRAKTPIEFDIGPSIQWRPTRNSHLDIVPLIGVTSDSPRVELWVVLGFDFGPGKAKEGGKAPVSLQSR